MPPIQLDVFSDIACPWCFIGKRRLEKAISATPEVAVEIRWRAFELQPHLPAEGVEMEAFFIQKFGGRARMQQAFEAVTAVAAEEGLAFAFSKMKRAPNTRLAHRLIRLASEEGPVGPVVEALFRGYFEQGADVSNRDELFRLVSGISLDWGRVRQRLEAGDGVDSVLEDQALAAQLGVDAVPFVLAGRRLAIRGAQPAEVFQQLLQRSAPPE